jgi:hypothetical protein
MCFCDPWLGSIAVNGATTALLRKLTTTVHSPPFLPLKQTYNTQETSIIATYRALETMASFLSCPDEILLHILHYLDIPDLHILTLVRPVLRPPLSCSN